MAIMFQKASKVQIKARIALIGPSGSGKTYTALRLAQALGERIAVADTEFNSASLYSDRFAFDVVNLESFHPQTCIDVIHAAETAAYDVLIIDSLSQFYIGRDGELELVDKAAKRSQSQNSFAAWREISPLHSKMLDAIMAAKLHVLVSMRAKTEWVIEKDERTGKNVPRKIGLAPVMKDGTEYSFDLVCQLSEDNTLMVTKSRCPALNGYVQHQAGEELGSQIKAWLTDGARMPEPAPRSTPAPQNGARATKAPTPATQSQNTERSSLLGQIMDAQLRLCPADLSAGKERNKWFGDLYEKVFGQRSWAKVQTEVPHSILAAGLGQLQAMVAVQSPSPAPAEDVSDGLVPGSDAAWAALEERSRAIGWTGLQWQGAREHLGYADVLAEIVALEPDPSQPELV